MKNSSSKILETVQIAIAVCGISAPASAQTRYDFLLIDSFNANPLAGEAYLWGINDDGVAVGTATVDNVIGYPGFYWDPSTGKHRFEVSNPQRVSNNGLAVGLGSAFDIPTGQMYTLPNLPGTYYSPGLSGVNDAGVGVGSISICSCSDSGGVLRIPYVWDAVNGGRTIDVPQARGLSRINNAGIAIGWLNGWVSSDGFYVDTNTGAYTYMSDVFPPDIGTGIIRVADINDAGEIVGSRAGTFPVYRYGFIYSPSNGVTVLPFPGAGYQQAVAPAAMNNAGTVVGTISTEFASQHVFVYSQADGLIDLNNGALITGMPGGYRLNTATDINNAGWIVGYGLTAAGKITGFVLKPQVAVSGDIDGDGHVALSDLALLLASFGLCNGDGGFNAAADFDATGCVELTDLATLLASFGA